MNYYVTVSFLNLLCYVLLGAARFWGHPTLIHVSMLSAVASLYFTGVPHLFLLCLYHFFLYLLCREYGGNCRLTGRCFSITSPLPAQFLPNSSPLFAQSHEVDM